MAVSLTQFRAALGSHAKGLSDADLQKRLDYMSRFSESFYDWWHERKGSAMMWGCGGTGAYVSDVNDDTDRGVEKIRATQPHIYLLLPEREVMLERRKYHKEQHENRKRQK